MGVELSRINQPIGPRKAPQSKPSSPNPRPRPMAQPTAANKIQDSKIITASMSHLQVVFGWLFAFYQSFLEKSTALLQSIGRAFRPAK